MPPMLWKDPNLPSRSGLKRHANAIAIAEPVFLRSGDSGYFGADAMPSVLRLQPERKVSLIPEASVFFWRCRTRTRSIDDQITKLF